MAPSDSAIPSKGGTKGEILFVTGFWSAETLGRTSTRATESYLRLFAELHRAVPHAMAVWIEPHLEHRVREIVIESAPAPRSILVKRFEDLPYSHLVERCEALPHMVNADPNGKESIPFSTTSWAKAALVDEAARLHSGLPGEPGRVAWIDFGLAHVADMTINWPAVEAAIRATDRIQVCEMRPTSPREIANLGEYYEYNRGRIAAGFFSASPDGMRWFAEEMGRAVDEVLEVGRVVLEEQIMSVICARHPDRFQPYSSDYQGVLRNLPGIERDLGTVLYALKSAREQALSARGLEIYRAVVRAGVAGFRIEPQHAARLFYEAQICAWYVERAVSDDVARLAIDLHAAGCAEVRDAIDKFRPGFDRNLRHAGLSFDVVDPAEALERVVARDDFAAWKGCL